MALLKVGFLCLVVILCSKGTFARDRDRPRNITAEFIDSSTVLLKWLPPKSQDSSCATKRYLIRLKEEGVKRSQTMRVDGDRNSLKLSNLKQDVRYYIRLLAITCHGKGGVTRWYKLKTENPVQDDGRIETEPPGKPENVRTRTLTTSIILTWDAPDDETLNRGYMVGYGQGVPDVNWQYVEANTRDFTIENLKPGTQYVISLRAFNNYGKGPVVYDIIYTRKDEDEPTLGPILSSPVNLNVKILSPTTAWLEWTDPSLGRSQIITDNRYYSVNYKSLPEGKAASMIVKALHVVLYELTPATRYEFRVKVLKGSQSSTYSLSVYNKTFEAPPTSAPKFSVYVSDKISNEVHVTWEPPAESHGDITGYLLYHTTNITLPDRAWVVDGMAADSKETILTGLAPNTTYHFKMQARNSKGYGPFTSTSMLRTPSVPKSPPRNLIVKASGTTVTLGWYQSGNKKGIVGFSILYTTDRHLPDDEWEHAQLDGLDARAVIEDLYADKTYYFKVAARSHDGIGAFSTIAAVDTTSEPVAEDDDILESLYGYDNNNQTRENFTIVTDESSPKAEALTSNPFKFHTQIQHKVSAVLSWSVNLGNCDPPGDKLEGTYDVQYFDTDDPGHKFNVSTASNAIILDNLAPNKVYEYRVKVTWTKKEESDWHYGGIVSTYV